MRVGVGRARRCAGVSAVRRALWQRQWVGDQIAGRALSVGDGLQADSGRACARRACAAVGLVLLLLSVRPHRKWSVWGAHTLVVRGMDSPSDESVEAVGMTCRVDCR